MRLPDARRCHPRALARTLCMVQHRGVGEGRRTQPNWGNPTANQRRLTVHEAARRLRISEDAVRMRVKRGTLEAEREGGRLYVLLRPDDRTNGPHRRADSRAARPRAQSREPATPGAARQQGESAHHRGPRLPNPRAARCGSPGFARAARITPRGCGGASKDYASGHKRPSRARKEARQIVVEGEVRIGDGGYADGVRGPRC
jgi:excisionase family DNA binding protein